ncbi:glycine-rich protein 5-like [Pistacia vera]|uniref:glycine-rich protein 5-like n=1 Tax=Pistacia vera TaxID=55513 RepID=UPI001263160E|nr:glycine-rich protein 5-like [Pistacia vera]
MTSWYPKSLEMTKCYFSSESINEFRLKKDNKELFGRVDGVCGGGEAFGGSDDGDGDKFDGERGLVGGLATGGGREFVGGVNIGVGGGELLGGLDTCSGGGNEFIGGLDATGDGGGGRHELVGGLDIGGDGGGDVGEMDC